MGALAKYQGSKRYLMSHFGDREKDRVPFSAVKIVNLYTRLWCKIYHGNFPFGSIHSLYSSRKKKGRMIYDRTNNTGKSVFLHTTFFPSTQH